MALFQVGHPRCRGQAPAHSSPSEITSIPLLVSLTCSAPQVPQQPNNYSCGVYVIHFANVFFSDAEGFTAQIQVLSHPPLSVYCIDPSQCSPSLPKHRSLLYGRLKISHLSEKHCVHLFKSLPLLCCRSPYPISATFHHPNLRCDFPNLGNC